MGFGLGAMGGDWGSVGGGWGISGLVVGFHLRAWREYIWAWECYMPNKEHNGPEVCTELDSDTFSKIRQRYLMAIRIGDAATQNLRYFVDFELLAAEFQAILLSAI